MPNDKRQRQKQGRQMRQEYLRQQQKKARQRRQAIAIAVVVAMVLALTFLFSGKGKKSNVSTSKSTTTAAPSGPPRATPVPAGAALAEWACPKADGSSARTDQFPKTPPPMCIDPAKTYVAKLATSEGDVEITLDTKKTPNTANNYVVLSRYHYFDGTSIDRIDTSIDILQTGSPRTQSIGDPGPGYSIKDEGTGFHYTDGDVVMARSQGPDSGAAQYFFVVGPKASALDAQGTYVSFGKVTKGLDVLHAVEALYQPCAAGDQSCLGGAPSRVVTIKSVTITES